MNKEECSKDFIKNIPIPLFYGKIIRKKDEIIDYEIEFSNDKMLTILNSLEKDIIKRSIRDILPCFRVDKYFSEVFRTNKYTYSIKRYI